MAKPPLLPFRNFRASIDPMNDIETLATMLAKQFEDIYGQLPEKGVSGTFVSADIPAKTITVVNGVVTEIKFL